MDNKKKRGGEVQPDLEDNTGKVAGRIIPPKTSSLNDPHKQLDKILGIVRELAAAQNGSDLKKVLASSGAIEIRALLRHFSPIMAHNTPSPLEADIEKIRDSVGHLLHNNLPVSEHHAVPLGKALQALNSGEVQGIVRASVTGNRDASWTIARTQFLVLINTWILKARGRKITDIREDVGARCGVTGGTVRKWESTTLTSLFTVDCIKTWRVKAVALGKASFPNDGTKDIMLNWQREIDAKYAEDSLNQKMMLLYAASQIEEPSISGYMSPLDHAISLYNRAVRNEKVQIPHWLSTE
jgi:hypothetical protein